MFGVDLKTPSQAALFPPHPLTPTTVESYREEVMLSLSSARALASKRFKQSQEKAKKRYDKNAEARDYRQGDWVLVNMPSTETGKNRKLSQPWYGPYRAITFTETDMTVEKVYRTQDSKIQVQRSRITLYPPGLPPGYFWYRCKHCCPGGPPRWVEELCVPSVLGNEEGLVSGRPREGVTEEDQPAQETQRCPKPDAGLASQEPPENMEVTIMPDQQIESMLFPLCANEDEQLQPTEEVGVRARCESGPVTDNIRPCKYWLRERPQPPSLYGGPKLGASFP